MRKHFRKTPELILHKIEEFKRDFIIATVLKIKEDDFKSPLFSQLNLRLENGEIQFKKAFMPHRERGVFSRRNLEGYRIRHPEEPKILKTYYLGERPIWGDYSKGTFSLYQTRKVTPYDEIPPKENLFITELLDKKEENNQSYYILKISINQIFNKNMLNFERELFFNLNLLQENIGSVNVYDSTTSLEEYLKTLYVKWEIFPPGEFDEDFQRVTQNMRNLTDNESKEIKDRLDFLKSENPERMIYGTSGMLRYFGAKFSDNLVVFENTKYGNALYIMFENWEELSKLSRLEIQNRPPDQYIRIRHWDGWKEKVKAILKAKRKQ